MNRAWQHLLIAPILVVLTALAAAAPPSIEDFYRRPRLSDPLLSPDNQRVAVAIPSPSGFKQLAVFDLAKPEKSTVIASFGDADVGRVQWVNNDRLVFSVAGGENDDRNPFPGLWAVNRDGSEMRQLVMAEFNVVVGVRGIIADRRLRAEWRLHSVLRDGSADVLVEAPTYDATWEPIAVTLARLDTRTGISTGLASGAPEHVRRWVVDALGAPAAVVTRNGRREASYLKTAEGWQQWQEGDAYEGSVLTPYWIGPKGELLALAVRGDTDALFQVDRTSLKPGQRPVVSTPGYDFDGQPVYDSIAHRVLGWRYETDATGTFWIDPGMKALQAEIDKLLPATINRIGCESCDSAATVLVSAASDRQPPIHYLYTRETHELQVLGSSRPQIDPRQMGLRDLLRFKARDGLEIPVLVTRPAGSKPGSGSPLPAVVLVHGGPWVRGAHWEWERDAQFLASRGYLVIEPEFRGSTGYGDRLYRAGFKQWGLAMQDDVADATQWAVKQGWADPKRVCIAGASYGGYATLMGLIRDPQLYQCGFQWVGVSDIALMYSINWSDFSSDWKGFGMPVLIGDRDKDAAQLTATSPLAQAARLKRPLLMAYGGEDHRVPLKHGTAFRDAVVASGAPVEWVVYPDEGHGWRKLETNLDWWKRVEKFLDKHIGPGSPAAAR